jgi:phospholipid/cholesterol/gamma-HCH transport system permease protein
LVLAGKLGASLAAEIGSMKITEQIEALETMSLDPIGFLVMPRILAGIIMLPIITIFSNFISIFSTFFAGTILTSWISPQEFISGLQIDFLEFEFYLGNMIKPCVYGFIISLVGSFFGLQASGGARGVGNASTNAVVLSAVLIVIGDYYLGELFLSL